MQISILDRIAEDESLLLCCCAENRSSLSLLCSHRLVLYASRVSFWYLEQGRSSARKFIASTFDDT